MIGKNIKFRTVIEKDASFILELRNVKGVHLSQTSISEKQQKAWIADYKKRERAELEYYFIIESLDHERLGLLRVYDLREDSFCWGSWIIKDDAPKATAIESVLLVYQFGFEELGFRNCHFDVRKENVKVIKFHESFNAKRTGETESDLLFNLTYQDYLSSKKKFIKFTK